MTADIAQLTAETCAPLVGTAFSLAHGDATIALKIDNIKTFEKSVVRDRKVEIDGVELPPRQAFALTLVGPASPELPQGIHAMTHPDLGDVALFLTCFGQDSDGMLYEILFN